MQILLIEPALAKSSFELPDLMLLQAWSEFHGMYLKTDLGHCMGGLMRGETITISKQNLSTRWTLWRTEDGIVAQSSPGPECRFDTIPTALAAVYPVEPEALTDLRLVRYRSHASDMPPPSEPWRLAETVRQTEEREGTRSADRHGPYGPRAA